MLVVVLFSGVVYLYMHYNKAQKLQGNIGKMITARRNSELIDSCLLNLYNADNSSRLYALTGGKKYINDFLLQMNDLNNLLTKINFTDPAATNVAASNLKQLLAEKTTKTHRYVQLRRLTDSLIRHSVKTDSLMAFSKIKVPVAVKQTVQTVVHVDTLPQKVDLSAPAAPVKKKKFFGRLIAAIAGKNKKEPELQPVAVKRDSVKTITQAATVYTSIPKKARSYYRKLYTANSNLRNNEHDILLINHSLVINIISELRQFKSVEMAYESASKDELNGKLTDVFKEYNTIAKLTFAALLLLIIVVLYNIWKIFDNDREIIHDAVKANEYADNKSRFMASMSHEIRTPLNAVIGFSEQLGMSRLNAEQTEQINAISNSSKMLLEVVNEILDFSKYETGKMAFEQQPFMLEEALNDVFTSLHIQAFKKGLSLRKSFLFDDELCFRGDMLRLKQVVMNLMGNAIKFTPSGEVLLQVMVIPGKNNKAILKVRIKDTGIGIKKQDLPSIFDEFSQVSDAQRVTRHKGTGLGLAICKKIVELQGGRIKVISEPKKGSVFSFEIPFEMADKKDCAVKVQMTEEELRNRVSGVKVLLAEDNQLNVLLAKTILKKWNISCDVGFNGQEAFTLFEDNAYDIVLTDIQMPIMGGLELISLIRQNINIVKASIPIITCTANVLKEDRDIYYQAGANDIVLKPFVERDLMEEIATHIKTKLINTGADQLSLRYG